MPALYDALQNEVAGIDLLLNNAGVLIDNETIETVRETDLLEQYRVNALAPVLFVQHLLPLLLTGTNACIANMSSSFASISRRTAAMPMRYGYSMSKAAVNMFTKVLAGELAPRGITVVALHPGWTRTQLGGPNAQFSPEDTARAVAQTLEQLTLAQTGSFLTWDGKEIPW